MKLAHTTYGSGPDVAFLHGFTQTKESWLPVIQTLTNSFRYTTIDAPGHGESPDGQRTLVEAGSDVAETMYQGVLVGYSMGARVALHAALQHPEKVTALVLISGTAGIDDANDRAERRESDASLAEHVEDIGVPLFIDEWLSNPMFSGLSPELADTPSRCSNTIQGLSDSLRYAGTGTQDPLWESLRELKLPVLLIAGIQDQKFTDIAMRMKSLLPQSELHIMQGVGHTCHLEDVNTFATVLQDWLLRVQSNR